MQLKGDAGNSSSSVGGVSSRAENWAHSPACCFLSDESLGSQSEGRTHSRSPCQCGCPRLLQVQRKLNFKGFTCCSRRPPVECPAFDSSPVRTTHRVSLRLGSPTQGKGRAAARAGPPTRAA
ncbi:uncharacterized protein ACIBXB_014111 isoform 1-T1 [Morphnus guianensis]